MINIEVYKRLRGHVETPGDIREHLTTLFFYGLDCKHITEFGVRDVVSSWAFLAAQPEKLTCVDIVESPNVADLADLAHKSGTNFKFILGDTLDPNFDIEDTDLLFIDTLHTYSQLKNELLRHGNKAQKYLVFHDTTTYAYTDEPSAISVTASRWNNRGLRPAITEFVELNPHWRMCNFYENNNGLTILKRV